MSSSTIPTISLEMARRMRPRPPSTIFLAQNDPKRAFSPSPYRNNMDQHFSLMSLDERAQPILEFSHQQDMSVNGSRAPSAMSTHQPMDQKRMLADNASDYSVDQRSRLKDSGFNSTHGGAGLTRSTTESSRSSSGRQSLSNASVQQQSNNNNDTSISRSVFYFDEEDEDLIDPEHMSVMGSNRPTNANTAHKGNSRFSQETIVLPQEDRTPTKQDVYIDWINVNIQSRIKSLTDLSSGEVLLEFLENLTNKEISRPAVMPGQTPNAQRMDRVIAAFKFMSIEGVDLDGSCTIRGN